MICYQLGSALGTVRCFFFLAAVSLTCQVRAQVSFARDIRPILSDNCFTCHGPDEGQREADLRLDREVTESEGVKDYRHVVQAGRPSTSTLIQRIRSSDPETVMPPPDSGHMLSPKQVALISDWVRQGATWEQHWAFVPPKRIPVPVDDDDGWSQNSVDRFVWRRLAERGLSPSGAANRRTLIRRASLTLTGLPPTPQQVDAFLTDRTRDAWKKVLDRLLSSPRYGERMAIDWLDAARYADTSGYQNDGPRDMWRWRDWVIEAFNSNMPFDQFTREQLAGDLLPNPSLNQRIATGFNRNHRGNAEGGIIAKEYQVEYVVDRVDTTATVWLGLTMGCARCHDHKYDPISQEDFYRTFAFFNNIPEYGRAIKEGNSAPWIKAPTTAQQTELARLNNVLRHAAAHARQAIPRAQAAQTEWESSGRPAIPDSWTIDRDQLLLMTLDKVPAAMKSVTLVDGRVGRALDTSTDGDLEFGDHAGFSYFDRFSVSLWVSPKTLDGTLICRMVPVPQGTGWAIHLEDGHVQVNLVKRWLDDSVRVQSHSKLAAERWQHVTVTYDGTRKAAGIRIFVDGEAQDIKVNYDFINQSFAVEEPLRLGRGHSDFHGLIDHVQIHSRVLSPAEISVLSVADSPEAIRKMAPNERTARQQRKLATAWRDIAAPADLQKLFRDAVAAKAERDAFDRSLPTVMVMEEMKTPRTTHVLNRGRYDAPGKPVRAGTPGSLPAMAPELPRNRLGFAEWLLHPGHPLTSRVAVNRIWQMHFGRGLVQTPEDFGSQGTAPTHPLLLDWLALELIDSGWDLHHIHRVILSSAVWQQQANFNASESDPDNKWYHRGPRFRLPAEVVRDQALFVSGLLTEKVGGPSVQPYQPAGLWKEIASTTDYNQSTGPDLYRRSLYTYWKRTVAPPSMLTLDATAREACVVRRSRTNTPLQALALMNDVTFVEAARNLADRILEAAESDAGRITAAWNIVLGRMPSGAETKVIAGALKRARDWYRLHPEDATDLVNTGESAPRSGDAAELAAWAAAMSLLLNLDETITLE